MFKFICQSCGREYPQDTLLYKCECGGLFQIDFDCAPLNFNTLGCAHGIWRYINSMPVGGSTIKDLVTMGEGSTPLISLNPLSNRLLAKCDYYMPTLSFKDRGASVLITHAKSMGLKSAVCDSSGNAGTAIAAYCARAGLKCDVYVPEVTSDKKVQQMLAHNARIHKIPGSREDTASAAINAVEETRAFYASHIFNPLFYEGTKTYFFEVYEQLGQMPDGFIIPAGNGTLLLGALRAFEQLMSWGLIDVMPKIYAVQADGCAPVYQAFKWGVDFVEPIENKGTLAEGIAIAAPARGRDILAAIRKTQGDVITVTDDETLNARKEMAVLGVYVEITSAANYAGYKKYTEIYPELRDKTIVMPLCGAGIKSA